MAFKKNLSIILLSSIISVPVFAEGKLNDIKQQVNQNDLREQKIFEYVSDLEKADYRNIIQLFAKNGFIISNSTGKMNAKEFYYNFLPNVKSAQTEVDQIYLSDPDTNRLAARFHFKFELKSGEKVDGEYIDEFVFEGDTNQFHAVYMFDNEKFH